MSNLTNEGLAAHARQMSRIAAAMIEMEGMKAENEQRVSVGLSLAYTEYEFSQLLKSYELDENGINNNILKISPCL